MGGLFGLLPPPLWVHSSLLLRQASDLVPHSIDQRSRTSCCPRCLDLHRLLPRGLSVALGQEHAPLVLLERRMLRLLRLIRPCFRRRRLLLSLGRERRLRSVQLIAHRWLFVLFSLPPIDILLRGWK